MDDRYYWIHVLHELRNVFIRTESLTSQKLKADTGVWVEYFLTFAPHTESPGGQFQTGGDEAGGGTAPSSAAPTVNEVAWISLKCRGVSLPDVAADANITIMYTLENQLKECPLFDPANTGLTGNIVPDDTTGTFSYNMKALLKRPLKL